MRESCLSTDALVDLFAEEVELLEGHVLDTFQVSRRLFTRSILPLVDQVQPNDRVQGGVALKAAAGEIGIYPYVFRKVCRNGAIMAHATDAIRLSASFADSPASAEFAVREAIRTCGRKDIFLESVRDIAMTTSKSVDFALMMLPMLASVSQHVSGSVLQRILDRFFGDEERSQFSLMNAITSVARETIDPEQRWRLEELGGAIGANLLPPAPSAGFGIHPQVSGFLQHEGSGGRRSTFA